MSNNELFTDYKLYRLEMIMYHNEYCCSTTAFCKNLKSYIDFLIRKRDITVIGTIIDIESEMFHKYEILDDYEKNKIITMIINEIKNTTWTGSDYKYELIVQPVSKIPIVK